MGRTFVTAFEADSKLVLAAGTAKSNEATMPILQELLLMAPTRKKCCFAHLQKVSLVTHLIV